MTAKLHAGAPALRLMSEICDARRPRSDAVAAALRAVACLAALLRSSPCRLLPSFFPAPLVVLGDGSCETFAPSVGIGACFFSREGRAEFFGCRVDDRVVGQWATRGDQQVIGQAEILPVLIALSSWSNAFVGRPVLVFIDNDSARHGLIAGYSPVISSAILIIEVWSLLASLGCHPWLARVPTSSNVADGPSRMASACLDGFPAARRIDPSFDGASGSALWGPLAARLAGGR